MATTGTVLDRYCATMSQPLRLIRSGGADHVSAWQLADQSGSFVAVANYG
jgi:hypothetical protein